MILNESLNYQKSCVVCGQYNQWIISKPSSFLVIQHMYGTSFLQTIRLHLVM